jgi:hypothetical protein
MIFYKLKRSCRQTGLVKKKGDKENSASPLTSRKGAKRNNEKVRQIEHETK